MGARCIEFIYVKSNDYNQFSQYALFPGGFGTPLGRQKDRSAGSPLDWTSPRQAKHLLQPRPRKRGSGAESAGYDRCGECRGEAPEGERAPNWRAAAPRASACGDIGRCGADQEKLRLSALRSPRLISRGGNESNKARARMRRGNDVISPLPAARGEGARTRRETAFSNPPLPNWRRQSMLQQRRGSRAGRANSERQDRGKAG
jgi:hypothetical protein